MTDHYEELSRQATKGNADALKKLFELAENTLAEAEFEKAASIFQDSAICYRIEAFRHRTLAEEAENREALHRAEQIRDKRIYHAWIETHPNGPDELPYTASSVTKKCITQVVSGQLFREEEFFPVFDLLYRALSESGTEFYSPGGSLQRRVSCLLHDAFGLNDYDAFGLYASGWLDFPLDIRIGLDILAVEVVKRCQS